MVDTFSIDEALEVDVRVNGIPYRVDGVWLEKLDDNFQPTEKYKEITYSEFQDELIGGKIPFKEAIITFMNTVKEELKQNEGLDITTEIKLNEVLENLNYVVGYF